MNENEIINCHRCEEELGNDELESPRMDEGNVICDECYFDLYQDLCPICEEHFDKAKSAEDYYFAITKDIINDENVKYEGKKMIPGIYKALAWPIYSRGLLCGFNGFNDGTVELLKEINFDGESFCEEICHDCLERLLRPGKKIVDFDEFSHNCEHQFIAESEDFGNNPQCRLREQENMSDMGCEDSNCEKCETTNLAHLREYDIDLYYKWVREIQESGYDIEEFVSGSDKFSMDLNFFYTEYNYVLVVSEE